MIFRDAGAAQTPNINHSRPAQKPCIKNPDAQKPCIENPDVSNRPAGQKQPCIENPSVMDSIPDAKAKPHVPTRLGFGRFGRRAAPNPSRNFPDLDSADSAVEQLFIRGYADCTSGTLAPAKPCFCETPRPATSRRPEQTIRNYYFVFLLLSAMVTSMAPNPINFQGLVTYMAPNPVNL
jgi:hypothetical protein